MRMCIVAVTTLKLKGEKKRKGERGRGGTGGRGKERQDW